MKAAALLSQPKGNICDDRISGTAALSEQYKLIFSKSPTGILYFDHRGIITECNEKFVTILGSRKERLIGLPLLSLPDKNIVAAIEQVLDGKEAEYDGLYRSVTSDSAKTTPVLALFSPVLDEDQRVLGGIGIIEDNTTRYNYQKKIERSEQAFRSLFEHHPDGVLSVDLAGKITDLNYVVEHITQYKREQLLGSDISKLIRPRDRLSFEDFFFNPGQTTSNTFKTGLSAKSSRTVAIVITRIPIVIDDRTEGYYAVMADISKQVETENLLEKTYKVAKIGRWESNIQEETFYWSNIAREIFETGSNTAASYSQTMSFFSDKNGHEVISSAMEAAVNNGESFDLELEITTAANNKKWVRVIGEPEFHNDACVKVYGSVQDINDLKRAQIASEQSRELLHAFTDRVRAPIFIKDNEGRYLLVNKEFRKHFCSDNSDIIGKNEFDLLDESTARYVHENDKIVIETNKSMVKERKVSTNAGIRHFLTHTFPLTNTAGLYRGIGGLSTDITELQEAKDRAQKQREAISYLSSNKRLAESAREQRLRAISRVIVKTLFCDTAIIWIENDALYSCKSTFQEGKIAFKNKMARLEHRFTGILQHLKLNRIFVSPDIRHDSRIKELLAADIIPEDTSSALLSGIYLSGEIIGFIGAYSKSKDKNWAPDEMNFTMAMTDQVSNVIIDEERKAKENLILGSLKEKGILLAEIHHRVKNNLAVISSMLQLQAMQSANQDLQDQLMNSVGRISAMAAIHEQLYRNENFSQLDFSDNLQTLVDSIIKATPCETNVSVAFDCSPVTLSVLQAIPCSLIVNEVVTNILKYAFKNRKTGLITCKLQADRDLVFLKILDDGNELPREFMTHKNEITESSNSLGLKIIQVLAEQLYGEYSYQSNQSGTVFRLDFPLK